LKIFGNPRIKIPQILETDINDKIIIAYKVTPEGNRFLNYMIKNKNGTLSFRGSSKNSYNDDKWSTAVTWTDSYNNGHTIMDLLIKEYDKMRDIDWSTTHYCRTRRKPTIFSRGMNAVRSPQSLYRWQAYNILAW